MPFSTQPPYNITNVVDVTGSRSLDVRYTNTTGRTMFVMVSVEHTITDVGGYALIDLRSPDVALGASTHTGIAAGAVGLTIQTCTIRAIPPGQTYNALDGHVNGTNLLASWIEAW